jgi:beta-glucanase (GH16 family)
VPPEVAVLEVDRLGQVRRDRQEAVARHEVHPLDDFDFHETFHVYIVEWEENEIRFYVDDKLYHKVEQNPEDDFHGWPFDQKFHLIMNLAVGGNWGGKEGIDENIWPQRMEVDYVRVYE